ncbi:MAG TPA: tetratricopeptide repeat protein, partial [Pyrinomonadaceae bacterium]|nr:tetratricopeptide repeat protein [Pyrinomonadaceae bacterium]
MKKFITLIAFMIFTASIHAQETAGSVNRLGLEHLNHGRYDAAVSQFEQAIEMKPDYALAHYNLGTSYFYLRRFDRAIGSLSQAKKLDPTSAAIANQLGAVYLDSGDKERAI